MVYIINQYERDGFFHFHLLKHQKFSIRKLEWIPTDINTFVYVQLLYLYMRQAHIPFNQ